MRLDEQVGKYIRKVVIEAFNAINSKNDSEYVVYSLKSQHYILLIKSSRQNALTRIVYRLSQNFKKNFGVGITVQTGRNGVIAHMDNDDASIWATTAGKGEMYHIDPNHDIFYDQNTPFGDVTIGIVPKQGDGKFKDALFPGEQDGRILYLDLIRYHNTDSLIYSGREGWKQYCKDYAAICGGLSPTHSVKVERIVTYSYKNHIKT